MPPILFIFSLPPNSIPSKSIKSCSPCAPRRSFIFFYPSVITPACFWLIVVWYLMFGGRPRPRRMFFYYKFSSIILMAKRRHGVSPTRSAPVVSPLQDHYHRRRQLLVGCCVLPSTLPSKVNDPPVSLIFSSINLSPQTTSNRPPHTFLPGLPFSPT